MKRRIPPDRNERIAALDTSYSCHVEAPAGSGKTYLLTSRFLKLLGEVDHPGEILALTFTRKAAGEMRSRIIDSFSRAENNQAALDPDDELLLGFARRALQRHSRRRSLLFSMDGLNIMTFHSFCFDLSKRAPLESSLPPDFTILEEDAQALLISETLDGFRRKMFRSAPDDPVRQAFEKRLLFNNNRWTRFESEMKDIITKRERFEHLIREVTLHGIESLPDVLRNRLSRHVEIFLRHLRKNFQETSIGRDWESFVRHLSLHGTCDLSRLGKSLPGISWNNLPEWQFIASLLLTKEGKPRRRFGQREGFDRGFSGTIWAAMISGMPLEVSHLLREACDLPLQEAATPDLENLKDLILMSSELISEYDERCRTRHVVDFTRLEQSALRALDEDFPADIQLYLDYRIRHLLIDEFQDTSLNQWILLQRLVSGWEPGDGRTVFLVGDPKQSIYGFRDAQVRLFLDAKKGIPVPGAGRMPLRNLALHSNFRSAPLILNWVNGLFGEVVMSSPKAEYDEVSYGPPIKSGKEAPGRPSLSISLFTNDDTEKAKIGEAKWMAGCVREAMIEFGPNSSIGILLFNRNRLHYYLRALKESNVPVQVQEGLPLDERPEIRHLLQFARAVTRPHDDLAWASLLRSPWFWCDISTLHELSRIPAGGWRERLFSAGSVSQLFERIIRPLECSIRRVGRDSLGQVVRYLWESLDGPRITAARYGMNGVANCMRFFEMMEKAETGIPLLTLNRLERVLERLYEPPDPTLSRSAVHMMTVHRAKGLEFDIVFLPYLDWRPLSSGPRTPPPYLLERLPGDEGDYLLALGPDSRRGETTAVFRMLNTLQKQRVWGEAKRLFYVAATRARTALFMSAVTKSREDAIHAEDKSILKFVFEYEGLSDVPLESAESRSRLLSIDVNPPVPGAVTQERTGVKSIQEPISFDAEVIPYCVRYPSTPAEDLELTFQETTASDIRTDYGEPPARGTVVHRLLHTFFTIGRLPSLKAVFLALQNEGMSEDTAGSVAGDILQETADTLNDPFIRRLLNDRKFLLRSEWSLDSSTEPGILCAGTIDLAAFDGKSWWIIDFKTSRPVKDESISEFLGRQEKRYLSQMNAYRSMLSNLKAIALDDIHLRIYFTALRLWHDIS